MKPKHILIPLLLNAFMYLLASFIAVDFDFRNWESEGRGVLAFIFLVMSTVGVFIATEINDKK
jgi:glucose uptake protein GlcU